MSQPAHPFDLTGRRALVTGAARGLGLEIARALGASGAAVLLNGRTEEGVAKAVGTLSGADTKVRGLAFDVADETARNAAIATIVEEGGVDILVNNVGVRRRGPIEECPPEPFRDLLEANLVAPFALARTLAPGMASRGYGRIINMVSIAGPRARSGDAAYTAAKGGLSALTRALAAEFGRSGVTTNGIAPGFFATETNAHLVDEPTIVRFVDERIPLARWGQPPEIAGAAVFLASPAASYVNGHVLTVDGGLSIVF